MPGPTPLVASLCLVAYVAAIGVDCEQAVAGAIPPRAVLTARPSAEPHGLSHAEAAPHSHARSGHARSHVADGAAPTGSVSDRTGHHSSRQGLARRHGLGPRDPETGESPPLDRVQIAETSILVLAPTCLCGCSRTRSRIGGPAGRLGAVVPGVELSRLPEAPPERGFAPRTPRLVGLVLGRDPIPI